MSENDQVTICRDLTTPEGCHIEAGTEGTLMRDMGDGDWLVYVPAKGSPLLREGRDFREAN